MEAFVYCWTDHKTNKLYVGSHKGTIDDGYVCSSRHMMKEYKLRPNDFTRQIVAECSWKEALSLETAILKAVNARVDEQFYNKHNGDGFIFEGWKKGQFSEEHRRNMSIAQSKRKRSPEHLAALHEGRKRSKNSNEHNMAIIMSKTGTTMSEESKIKARKTRMENNDTKKLASNAGKISAQKYQNDIERQKKHSERMKIWWSDRKKKEGLVDGD